MISDISDDIMNGICLYDFFKAAKSYILTNISVFSHLVTSIEQPKQFLDINKFYLQLRHYCKHDYIKK